jgi:phage anti-repressor protein
MQQLIAINHNNSLNINAVSARDLYLGLGLASSVWSRWSKTNIENNEFFTENKDWIGFNMMLNGNETRDYAVSLDFAKHIAMQAKTQKSHEYRNYFIECEKRALSKIALPDFTNPAESARAWALEFEEKQKALFAKEQAETERDYAIKTKHHISDKKTATAMATASALSKKVKQLEIQLNQSNDYCTVRNAVSKGFGKGFNWRTLVNVSEQLGFPPKKVQDDLYGEVNSYHRDVWQEAYGITI